MDNKRLTQLKQFLASLIPFKEDALTLVQNAGISTNQITWSNNSTTMWASIVNYAKENQQLNDLVKAILDERPKNPHLLAFASDIELDYSQGPPIDKVDWKGTPEPKSLEKIMGKASTLLPIYFFSMGLERAKAVAKIEIPRPNNKLEVGTGFLIDDDLLLTNYHVIRDAADAAQATIKFNYEESRPNVAVQPTPLSLDPDNGFATSGSIVEDWTIVRMKGADTDALKDFRGGISLREGTDTQKDDFVNIIQHPAGGLKQIGLYHNLVTFSDNAVVQYLTDTEAGSSGSPVFNSKWNIVALHHSGGMLREPNSNSKDTYLRNEGIPIKTVLAGIQKKGFLQ